MKAEVENYAPLVRNLLATQKQITKRNLTKELLEIITKERRPEFDEQTATSRSEKKKRRKALQEFVRKLMSALLSFLDKEQEICFWQDSLCLATSLRQELARCVVQANRLAVCFADGSMGFFREEQPMRFVPGDSVLVTLWPKQQKEKCKKLCDAQCSLQAHSTERFWGYIQDKKESELSVLVYPSSQPFVVTTFDPALCPGHFVPAAFAESRVDAQLCLGSHKEVAPLPTLAMVATFLQQGSATLTALCAHFQIVDQEDKELFAWSLEQQVRCQELRKSGEVYKGKAISLLGSYFLAENEFPSVLLEDNSYGLTRLELSSCPSTIFPGDRVCVHFDYDSFPKTYTVCLHEKKASCFAIKFLALPPLTPTLDYKCEFALHANDVLDCTVYEYANERVLRIEQVHMERSASRVLVLLQEKKKVKREVAYRYFACHDEGERKELDDCFEELLSEGKIKYQPKKDLYTLEPELLTLQGVYTPKAGKKLVKLEANELGLRKVTLFGTPVNILPGDTIAVTIDRVACLQEGQEYRVRRTPTLVSVADQPFPVRIVDIFGDDVVVEALSETVRLLARVAEWDTTLQVGDIALATTLSVDEKTRVLSLAKGKVQSEQEESKALIPSYSTVLYHEQLVCLNHGVPNAFPEQVLSETLALPSDPLPAEKARRTDLTALPFVTIDGASAKDFDDAIFVRAQEDGSFELMVAIADVSHYVRSQSALDKEALRRGNSWYFPTRVFPMLPEKLSNGLCSLAPHCERLVTYVRLVYSAKVEILKTDFGCGFIRSAARLTYDQAKAMLIDHDQAVQEAFYQATPQAEAILQMLHAALELSRRLRRMRTIRGNLDFHVPDVEVTLTPSKTINTLHYTVQHELHQLIEEFMIAANEAVARKLEQAGVESVYRIHPLPSPEKLTQLFQELRRSGLVLPKRKSAVESLRALLQDDLGAEMPFISQLCIRSLEKASYSTKNLGHFGLASTCYCHFTSPIRRYADILVHRALKRLLHLDDDLVPSGKRLERVVTMINQTEFETKQAEREMNKRLACLWALQHQEQCFTGLVSSIMPFGTFVALDDYPVEGMIARIPLEQKIEFARGREVQVAKAQLRCLNRLVLGSKVTVCIKSIDMERLYINFALRAK